MFGLWFAGGAGGTGGTAGNARSIKLPQSLKLDEFGKWTAS